MHELSIATRVVAQAEAAARAAGAGAVRGVRLRVGALANVVPGSLLFAWDVATTGTALAGSTLTVDRVEPVVFCQPCQAEVTLASTTRFRCPHCDTPSADIRAGRELELASLEVEDPPITTPNRTTHAGRSAA